MKMLDRAADQTSLPVQPEADRGPAALANGSTGPDDNTTTESPAGPVPREAAAWMAFALRAAALGALPGLMRTVDALLRGAEADAAVHAWLAGGDA